MKRKIIEINESRCNGCEQCVTACHEGAIQMVNGKAKLVSDAYCDGLGDCLPECPTAAITMIEREAAPYDEELVMEKGKEREIEQKKREQQDPLACGCPGMNARTINRAENVVHENPSGKVHSEQTGSSHLSQWPVQLHLVHPHAPYLKEAHLLIAADCTAYAYGNFHRDFIKGRIVIIGCPKLDDQQHYQEKLTEMLRVNQPASITVIRMQVPCCGGIVTSVRQAMLSAGVIVPYREVTISTDGRIIEG